MRDHVWTNGEVHAAGGLVIREGSDGVELVVVHRPQRNDWSFPKGHLEPGETAEEAALREVGEETGLQCRLLDRLDSVHYIDHRGAPKVVDYWSMAVTGGEFRPNDEVDELDWLALDQAEARLTYEVDQHLVDQLRRSPPA